MLGWLKPLKKKFNKLPTVGQFLVAAVIIYLVRYLLKMLIYSNFTFSYLENFGNVTRVEYFYMNGCGHCEKFTPTWDRFTNQYKGSVKLNKTEQSQAGADTLKKYGVEGFPTVVKIDESGNYETFTGERTVEGLKKFINQ